MMRFAAALSPHFARLRTLRRICNHRVANSDRGAVAQNTAPKRTASRRAWLDRCTKPLRGGIPPVYQPIGWIL